MVAVEETISERMQKASIIACAVALLVGSLFAMAAFALCCLRA